MMKHDDVARDVARALATLRYELEFVPESTDEVADLWAHKGSDSLVVEIKTRIDDRALMNELQEHSIVERDQRVVRSDGLGRTVRKAWSQIRNTQTAFPGLGLLWFQPTPLLGMSAATQQMEANLLGGRTVSFKLGNRSGFAPAFLVTRCDFHRYPDLDAAVVMGKKGGHLLVNPFGERKEELRSTALHSYFQEYDAVLDLDLLQSNEEHFVLRTTCNWSDELAILAALRRQHPSYGFVFSDTHFYHSVARVNLRGSS